MYFDTAPTYGIDVLINCNGAPAAHFARGDKFERELLKVGQSKNPALRLAFALATFQASGKFEPALRDWEAKPKADQTFVNFRVFIQKEFGKQHKQNKTTAKSVGYGIANSITDKEVEQIEQLEAQALFVAELANSMQEQSQKHFKEMMEVFKATFEKNSPSATNPKNPKSGAGGPGHHRGARHPTHSSEPLPRPVPNLKCNI